MAEYSPQRSPPQHNPRKGANTDRKITSSNYRIILRGKVKQLLIFNDIQVFVVTVVYYSCILVSRLLERESTAFLMDSSVDRSVGIYSH